MAWAYQGRGTALMYKGQMLEAMQNFNRALKYDPELAWAYINRGLVKVFLGNESEAQKDFDEGLKLKPELKAELESKINLARHLRRLGKSEE
jgi:tetratricopeptide (TPR) repeat protein